MKFQVLAKPTPGHQDKRVPSWLDKEPGIKVIERSSDRLIAFVETDPLTVSKLKLKLGEPWYVIQVADEEKEKKPGRKKFKR